MDLKLYVNATTTPRLYPAEHSPDRTWVSCAMLYLFFKASAKETVPLPLLAGLGWLGWGAQPLR